MGFANLSPSSAPPRQQTQRAAWQQELADAILDASQLCRELKLPTEYEEPARKAAKLFPLLVPRSYLQRMQSGNPHDPLLRQVLPLDAEFVSDQQFTLDPVGDSAALRAPGLLQKYAGRALLITTGACAIHCRYCFRRHYPYAAAPRKLEDWEPALQELRNDSTIHELLLSGGDPLTLTDARLGALIAALEDIPHLRRIRLHTRLPIVLPSRVTAEFLHLLRESRLTPIMVLHANHAQELTGDAAHAVRNLVRAGITTLNQAVLLRGINDQATSLTDLCERLIDLGVIPYYLHQLDRVAGAAHFEVPESAGRELMIELRRRLPGYAVPQYVREIAGEPHKTPISV